MISRKEIQTELRTLSKLYLAKSISGDEFCERVLKLADIAGLPAYVQHQGTNPLKNVNTYGKL